MPLTKFSSVITLSTSRTADPASAGIDRFVGLEHIEPENLHIRSWGLIADAYQAFKYAADGLNLAMKVWEDSSQNLARSIEGLLVSIANKGMNYE